MLKLQEIRTPLIKRFCLFLTCTPESQSIQHARLLSKTVKGKVGGTKKLKCALLMGPSPSIPAVYLYADIDVAGNLCMCTYICIYIYMCMYIYVHKYA